jgi:hypothetical protein
MPGPAVHYNIASCHYRLGDYQQAERAFRLVADRYPGMRTLAEYNLGLVFLRQNRVSEARRLFGAVRQQSTDPKLRSLAYRAMRRLDPSPSPVEPSVRWVGLLDFNVGHDDNVALIDDASLAANQSVDSPFTELVAVVSGPVSTAPGFRIDGSFYSVRYDDADGFDQNAARVGGVYHWRAGAWRLEAGPHFNYSTLNGDGFEQRVGAGLTLGRRLSATTVLSLRLVHDEVDGAESQFSFLEGSREQLGVTWDKYGTVGRLTLAYQLEINNRESASVAPTRNRLSVRYRYAMSSNWETDVLVAYRSSHYDDLMVTRDEDRTELSFGLVRRLRRGWQINGTYRWFDNDSNVDPYSYTRSRAVLGLTKNF